MLTLSVDTGVNVSGHHVAALSASPYPPILTNVRLAFNAYDAVNFSLIRGPAILQNVLVRNALPPPL
ncbi:unnamed protein product [Echinostoma caproni]|uniref:Lectin_legB domain-containing protein n=1 Tax=Echinostoma caproni TaxID=27848 RepID=A0A183A4E6_9TREM|nr:unnamed protein product [Echinostoma caproni]